MVWKKFIRNKNDAVFVCSTFGRILFSYIMYDYNWMCILNVNPYRWSCQQMCLLLGSSVISINWTLPNMARYLFANHKNHAQANFCHRHHHDVHVRNKPNRLRLIWRETRQYILLSVSTSHVVSYATITHRLNIRLTTTIPIYQYRYRFDNYGFLYK